MRGRFCKEAQPEASPEYFTAKRKAALQLGLDHRHHPRDLPPNREIRDQIQALADLYEGDKRRDRLKEMRIEALRMMRLLAVFRPRLIGSVLTGHVREGSDIDLHVFSNNQSSNLTPPAGGVGWKRARWARRWIISGRWKVWSVDLRA